MSRIDRLIARLQQGEIAYRSDSGPVYAGPTSLEREAASAIDQIRGALSLAVDGLMRHEPGDSRAVSDIAVALASVASGTDDDAAWGVIDAALEAALEEEEQRREIEADERRALEAEEMERHFRNHPHG